MMEECKTVVMVYGEWKRPVGGALKNKNPKFHLDFINCFNLIISCTLTFFYQFNDNKSMTTNFNIEP